MSRKLSNLKKSSNVRKSSSKNQLSETEKFLSTASEFKTGDLLTLSDFRLLEKAFEAIKRHAHQTRARRPREGTYVREIRRLIERLPDWRERVTAEQRKILELRFGLSGSDSSSAASSAENLSVDRSSSMPLSNAAISKKLQLSAQMITHVIREAINILRQNAPEHVLAGFSSSEHLSDAGTPADGLKTDEQWQQLLRWRRRLGKLIAAEDPESAYRISAADRSHVREVAKRLQVLSSTSFPEAPAKETEISAAVNNSAADVKSPEDGKLKRRGRRSPAEFREVRELLIARPELVERLTARQRATLRTGLALDVAELAANALLGYRRFDESEGMTAAKFGSVFKSARSRLLPFFKEAGE